MLDQLTQMIAQAQNDPAQMQRLVTSGIDPAALVAKLKQLGMQAMAPQAGGVPPQAGGVGAALAGPVTAPPPVPPGAPVPPGQASIGHLLAGG